jgi:hypothetical protein
MHFRATKGISKTTSLIFSVPGNGRSTMSRVSWRPVLLAICALAALIQIAGVIDATGMGSAPPWLGLLGANSGASSKPFSIEVTAVDPGGPADRAGLRRGDLIDIRANSLVERYSLLDAPLNGRPIVLSVHGTDSAQERLSVTPQPLKPTWNFWPGAFAALWLLLFAAMIAWRRSDVPQMRLLSLWLAVFVLTGAMLGFASPWAWMYVLLNISLAIVGPLSVGLLAAFASGFAQPLSLFRRTAQLLCYLFLAIFAVLSLVGIVGVITLRFDPLPIVAGIAALLPIAAAVLAAVFCGISAIAASRGVERQRAAWTLIPLAAFFCLYIIGWIANSSSSSYAYSVGVGLVSTLVFLTAPVALTYAALSRRLIDVGFFLNRAAVFTIVSAIVIGAFVLVESSVSEWLVTVGHTASTLISMGLALGLGLSLRFIHGYVDQFVDRVFFRKRHEDEAALRRFAHESSYITDRSTLLERAVREIKDHTDAAEATILVKDGAAGYSTGIADGARTIASKNDPGILALRAWHKPVDLGSIEDTVLRGEFAFPMVSRGTLVGVLVCGAKSSGENYAPDESDALLALAHGVGTALDVLSAQLEQPNELVLRELAELREDVKRLARTQGEAATY